MKISFTKMQGCGNDYIYINCLDCPLPDPSAVSVQLSDRHFGIGGDGIIMICPSQTADAKMRIFNADGSEAMMCGNGIRCVAKYLYDNSIARREYIDVESLSGIKHIRVFDENGSAAALTVDMGKASFIAKNVPVISEKIAVIDEPVTIADIQYRITCVSMGNPHCVVFGDDPDTIELERIGPLFEKLSIFPDRVNTEFIQLIDRTHLKMRVWERGSGETLACGTGTCAAVAAAVKNGYCDENTDIHVSLRGGELTINYNEQRVLMTGPAVTVFTGTIEI